MLAGTTTLNFEVVNVNNTHFDVYKKMYKDRKWYAAILCTLANQNLYMPTTHIYHKNHA